MSDVLVTVKNKCPFCGNESSVDDVNQDKLMKFLCGASIQEVFPDMPVYDRDILLNGTCHACFEKMYNVPVVSDPSTFGKFLGECLNCGGNIYEKDASKEQAGIYVCNTCATPHKYLNDSLDYAEEQEECYD